MPGIMAGVDQEDDHIEGATSVGLGVLTPMGLLEGGFVAELRCERAAGLAGW